jgi:primosomal protein N' (replication factor Y)
MIRIVVEGHDARIAQAFAEGLGERIDATLTASPGPARKLGPAPAPMARRRGRYRFQIHLHGPDGDLLRAAAGAATEGLKLPEEVYFTTDVDPIDMM